MATAFGLLPERALLNDLNPHVINFYKWLKRGLQIDLAMENSAGRYYVHRNRFNALVSEGRERTREAAKKNPKDPLANQFMLAAYQSKVDFMNQIADARGLEK